jgi:hypothetical protein
MRSPVSRRALGECNAITNQGFGPRELTFVSALETEFDASHEQNASTSSGTQSP